MRFNSRRVPSIFFWRAREGVYGSPRPQKVPPETDKAVMMSCYYCYWIVSGARCYFGATVNPVRRLRQHNCELVGGARRTRGRVWRYRCVVSGFRTWREALQFEWALKHCTRRCRGAVTRQEALERLVRRSRWTRNAPPASEVPLVLEYDPLRYGGPPAVQG